jgi:hypothetical protein
MAVHLWTTPHAVIAHRAHSTTTTSNQMAKRSTFENGEKWGDYHASTMRDATDLGNRPNMP